MARCQAFGPAAELMAVPGMLEAMGAHTMGGPAFALEDGDAVIAVGGIIYAPGSQGWAWFLAGQAISDAGPGRVRTIRRITDGIAAPLVAVRAYVRSGWQMAERFASFMGFRPETGVLERFGPDVESYRMWVRFP